MITDNKQVLEEALSLDYKGVIATLSIDEEYANFLVQENLLIPIGDSRYRLFVRSSTSEMKAIEVSVQYNDEQDPLFKQYTEFYDLYPKNNALDSLMLSKTNILSDEAYTGKAFENYKMIINGKHSSHDHLVSAMKYEVWWRTRNSTINNNLLTYMKRIDNWLANIGNIRIQLDDLERDKEYTKYLDISSGTDHSSLNTHNVDGRITKSF